MTNQGLSAPDRLYRAFKDSYKERKKGGNRKRLTIITVLEALDAESGNKMSMQPDSTAGRRPSRTGPASTTGTSGSRWSAA